MNFSIRIATFSLILLFSNQLLAQCDVKRYSKGKNKLLGVPSIFNTYVKANSLNKYTENGSSVLSSDVANDFHECRPWVVYSIRKNNKILKEATNNSSDEKVVYKASFNEKFYVEELLGNWLKIKKAKNEPAIGWIHAEDLIINVFAPLNYKGSTNKAIVIKSVSSLFRMTEEQRVAALRKEKYYLDDELKFASNQSPNKFEILFIYKKVGRNVLLASSDQLKGQQYLKGWVDESQIQPWDERICYELSDSRRAYEAYRDKPLHIFAEYNALTSFKSNDWKKPEYGVMRDVKLTGRRAFAQKMRMPIVPKNDFFSPTEQKIATFAGLVVDGSTTIPDNNTISLEELYNKISREVKIYQKKISNINIILLVDGTRSMSKYKNKIKSIVEELDNVQNLKGEDKLTNIRIGLVAYRGKNESGIFKSVESYPLTASPYSPIKSAITKLKFDSDEDDFSENVFGGFEKALEMFNSDETNILLHVGDCGHYSKDRQATILKAENIGKKLFEKSVNYLGIQTSNSQNGDKSYRHFIIQMEHIIETKLRSYELKLKGLINNSTESQYLDEIKIIKNTNSSRRIKWSTKDPSWYPFVTRFSYKDQSHELKEQEFYNEMEEGLLSAISLTEKYITKLEGYLNKIDPSGVSGPGPEAVYDEQFVKFLRSQGFKEESIKLLMAEAEICGEGFIETRYYDQNIDFLKKVVYMSVSWKERVLDPAFDRFSDLETTDRQLKDNLKNAFVQLAKAFYGEDESANIIEEMTINQIWQETLGIKFVGQMNIAQMKIAQINSSSGFSESEARKFAEQLQSEINSKWKGAKFSDEYTMFEKGVGGNIKQFLWVPIEYFPFSEPY